MFCETAQAEEKELDFHSMELVRQKRTAVRVWTELRRMWRWNALQRIFVVWRAVQSGKIPIVI